MKKKIIKKVKMKRMMMKKLEKLYESNKDSKKQMKTFFKNKKRTWRKGNINENKYKPWECLILKYKKFIKYHSYPKKQNEIFL